MIGREVNPALGYSTPINIQIESLPPRDVTELSSGEYDVAGRVRLRGADEPLRAGHQLGATHAPE
jgi:hypothetical protein